MLLNLLYLPYPHFRHSVSCYSNDTLKAALFTVVKVQNHVRKRSRYDGPWEHYEIWRAWCNHYQAFVRYALICYEEADARRLEYNNEDKQHFVRRKVEGRWHKPQWVGWEALHSNHRSNLLFLGLCELSASRVCIHNNTEPSVFDRRVRQWFDRAGFPREIYMFDSYHLTDMNSLLDADGAPYPASDNHYRQFDWAEEADFEIKRTALEPGEAYLC